MNKTSGHVAVSGLWDQGVYSHFCDTTPCICGVSLWEALFVVSQKWSFPTTLFLVEHSPPSQAVQHGCHADALPSCGARRSHAVPDVGEITAGRCNFRHIQARVLALDIFFTSLELPTSQIASLWMALALASLTRGPGKSVLQQPWLNGPPPLSGPHVRLRSANPMPG